MKSKNTTDAFNTERINQKNTINGVKELDRNIYTLDYKCDYFLNDVLERGVSSIPDLLSVFAKKLRIKEGSLKCGDDTGGGCSTFDAFTPEGSHTLSRNFDFRCAPCFVVWTHPKTGYKSVSVVDANFMLYGSRHNRCAKFNRIQALLAPYCCVDGVNECGLAIAVSQIKAKAAKQMDSSKKNITTTSAIRAVLDTCANVDEAVEFFKSYNMHDSLFCLYHYQIIDRSGRSVIVEYIDNKLYVYEKNSDKYPVDGSIFEGDGINLQYATNCSAKKDVGSFKVEQHGSDRAEAMINTLKSKNGILAEMESMDLLNYIGLDYKHPKYPWNIIALWSAVYNTEHNTVKLAANREYSRIYTFCVDEPDKVLSVEKLGKSAYPAGNWEYL